MSFKKESTIKTRPSYFLYKPKRKVDTVFVHCSASDNPAHDVNVIRQWHTDKGWADVGYHFFITHSGVVQEGRDLEHTPAAQAGYNTGSIAVCIHGLHNFSQESIFSLQRLCKEINEAYGGVRFRGHKEVNKNKTCPVIDYVRILNLDEQGYMK